jgi:hypothetical protein
MFFHLVGCVMGTQREDYKNVRLKDTTDMPLGCECDMMFSKAHEAPFMVISQTFTSKFAQPLNSNLKQTTRYEILSLV